MQSFAVIARSQDLLLILSLLRSPEGCGDYIEQLNVSPNSQHMIAGIACSSVKSTSVNELIKRLIPSLLELKFRIARMEDSKYQRRPYPIGIASEVEADLKDETAIELLLPTVTATLKSVRDAEMVDERNNSPLFSGPSCCLDPQALTLLLRLPPYKDCFALSKFCITQVLLEMLIQAPDKRGSLKWRLDKIPGCEELVQKCRTVFWFNAKISHLGIHLSRAPHCLQRDFIPVSIDQVRLLFTTELNHSILPCLVDQEAPRFKGKLGRNAAWPFFQDVQKRVIFHHRILP